MHKFNPKNNSKLDNPKRRQMMPPSLILEKLGLSKDDDMADIGCGIGYFTLPAARMIHPENKVYALDIMNEMLDEVKARYEKEKINNITLMQTLEYDLKLEDEKVSFALLVNVLHEVDDKPRMLKEIQRILKNNGRIALIEFDKRQTESGPPVEHRIEQDEALKLLEKAGFQISKKQEFADTFYAITAIKTKK